MKNDILWFFSFGGEIRVEIGVFEAQKGVFRGGLAVPENDLHDHHHPPERSLTGFGEKCLLKRLVRWRLFTPVRGGPITTTSAGDMYGFQFRQVV